MIISLHNLVIFLLLGAGAGLVAGLLGVGGGLVIVPVLVSVFSGGIVHPELVMHVAIGTSLATIVLTSLSSVYAHHRHGAVIWPIMGWLAPGIVFGALLGSYIADITSSKALMIVFGCFELLIALQMISGFKPEPSRMVPVRAALMPVGVGIGVISAILGIGGGTMTVPFLVWCNTPMQKAVATSAAAGVPIAIAGTIGYVLMGYGDVRLPQWSSGYIYWPALISIAAASLLFAPLGAILTHRLPTQRLKILFALILVALGIWMLIR